MKIPEKITVGAITYTVKEVGRINDSSNIAGRINYQLQEIELDANVAPAAKTQIFLHEVIHAIHHHTAQDRDTCEPSERDVDSMASALLMIMKDNPGIFAD